MKSIIQKMAVLLIPSAFWVALTALNIGAQSLSNIVELFGIILFSIICAFIPSRIIDAKYIVLILCGIALLLRLFMPCLPE